MKMGTSRRKGGHNVGQNQILEYLYFKVLTEIVITINLEGSDPESGLSDNEANKRRRVEEKGRKRVIVVTRKNFTLFSLTTTNIHSQNSDTVVKLGGKYQDTFEG